MNVFIPYPSPIDVAKCLDKMRLRPQINEGNIILNTLKGYSTAWEKHPAVKMYANDIQWLEYYVTCLTCYLNGDENAVYYSKLADTIRPEWMTEELCDQHKRRLYTKDNVAYPQFEDYGESKENWYVIDGEIVKYEARKPSVKRKIKKRKKAKRRVKK